MRLLKKALLYSAAICITMIILLLTPLGLQLSAKAASKIAPNRFSYQSASGSLWHTASIKNLTIHTDALTIQADDLKVNIALPALLTGKMHIKKIYTNTLSIVENNKSTASSAKTIDLSIDNGTINLVNYQNRSKQKKIIKSITIKNLNLSKNKVQGSITASIIQPLRLDLKIALTTKNKTWQLVGNGRYQSTLYKVTGAINKHLLTCKITHTGNASHQLDAHIFIERNSQKRFRIAINSTSLNLKRVNPVLPNIKKLQLNASGRWDQKHPAYTIHAMLSTKSNTAILDSAAQRTIQASWKINAPHLSEMSSLIDGSLVSTGIIGASRKKTTANIKIYGKKISFSNLFIEKFSSSMQSSNQRFTLVNTFLNFNINNKQLNKISITSTGDLQLKNIKIKTIAEDNNSRRTTGEIELLGELQAGSWNGVLKKQIITQANRIAWRLEQPTPLQISKTQFSLSRGCWHSVHGSSCLSGFWQDQKGWRINSDNSWTSLHLVTQSLAHQINIQAPTRLSMMITHNHHRFTNIDGYLRCKPGTLTYSIGTKIIKNPLKEIALSATTLNDQLLIQGGIYASPQVTASSTIKINDFFTETPLAKKTLNGTLNLSINNLQLISIFTPYLSITKGSLHSQLSIKGSINNPTIDGSGYLKDGSAIINPLKLTLNSINVRFDAKKKNIDYHFSAKSAGKKIKLSGRATLKNGAALHFSINGKHLLISDTPEYTIYASPSLQFSAGKQHQTLTGKIVVNKARLSPADYTSIINLPDDTIFIKNNDNQNNVRTSSITKKIQLLFQKDVLFSAFGLKSNIEGSLLIEQARQNSSLLATGQLTIKNGLYSMQDKILTVSPQSTINFIKDPIDNPHLNISASRFVIVNMTGNATQGPQKISVGINLSGTVKNPKITLFSTPIALSQSNILSYLLFDQEATEMGGQSNNLTLLMQAISQLKLNSNTKKFNIGELKHMLGISELGIQSQTSIDAFGTPLGINQSSFVFGKHFSKKLYFRYIRGILTPINIYQLKYLLNNQWFVQAELTDRPSNTASSQDASVSHSDIGSGIDFIYSIRRKQLP